MSDTADQITDYIFHMSKRMKQAPLAGHFAWGFRQQAKLMWPDKTPEQRMEWMYGVLDDDGWEAGEAAAQQRQLSILFRVFDLPVGSMEAVQPTKLQDLVVIVPDDDLEAIYQVMTGMIPSVVNTIMQKIGSSWQLHLYAGHILVERGCAFHGAAPEQNEEVVRREVYDAIDSVWKKAHANGWYNIDFLKHV